MFGMEKIGAAVLDKDISVKPTVVAQGISRVLKPKGFVIKGAASSGTPATTTPKTKTPAPKTTAPKAA
ncbi:hypothetical protein CLOM_g6123 [Closterium sp. NIES-68]|nr:hypothetical protein CLOM_g6123 [Closterium sp. NIES-68]GJP60858.1 hypothetical protein CLOP_g18074 [Closterium sp. NIES-67]GJP86744.1 hypothetical protein CLOP_g16730 [Closterium sp. NIES-67]